ncbi:GlxA family transcriptional regulator [Pseudomonas tolaasii]
MQKIGVVLYPGFQAMGLAVNTVFEFANVVTAESIYDVRLLSVLGGLIKTSAGFVVGTEAFSKGGFDTIVVLGDNFAEPIPLKLIEFLQQSYRLTRRIASVCTGAFILAQAGLLDERRATTHWWHAPMLKKRYPKVKLEEDKIFIIDGSIWTSAGMSAGVDLALAMVEKDLGADIARLVAKQLVVYSRRSGGQSQFSVMLEMEAKTDRIQSALIYARQNLRSELSVEELASVANLSPRQFSRVFSAETGCSPAKAVERLRVESARLMLESGRHSMDIVARDSGFGDTERMRRAFLRALGHPPSMLQRANRIPHTYI